jgi:putative zinc finger/helix-turn-helix YgiT family protein
MSKPKVIECDFCEGGTMSEVRVRKHIQHGRAKLVADGLKQWQCDVCQSVMTDASQFEHNREIIREAESKKSGYLTVPMLREFREKYRVSQREASRLIGAGKSAFGKYESGARISKPTAKLIRVALAIPEAAHYLAVEEGIEISVPHGDDMDINAVGWIKFHGPDVNVEPLAASRGASNMDRFLDIDEAKWSLLTAAHA